MINRNPKETSPKLWVELIIFISAYYPLFIILLIRDIGADPSGIQFIDASLGLYISLWAVTLFLLSSITSLLSIWLMQKNLTYQHGGKEIRVKQCRQIHGDMLNYTLPFLIGLFAFDYNSWQSIVSLLVFLAFIFSFVHKDRIVLLNPMFLLMGIRLYDMSYSEVGQNLENNKTVLCLGELSPSREIIYIKSSAGIQYIYPAQENKGDL